MTTPHPLTPADRPPVADVSRGTGPFYPRPPHFQAPPGMTTPSAGPASPRIREHQAAAVPAPPPDARARLLRVAPLVRPVLGLLIVAAVGYAVVSQWSEVGRAIQGMAWQSLLLAAVAVVAGTMCGVMSWRALLAEEGHPLSVADASRVCLVGQLGKYLPGSVWSVVIQMELALRLAVPRARTFTTTLCWTGLSLSSALTIGLVGVPVIAHAHTAFLWVLLALLPIALVCSTPRVLTRLVRFVLKVLRRPPLPHEFTWRGVRHAFGWLLLIWLFYGCHLWLLANSLGAPGFTGLLRCLGGFALAVAAGIAFVVAPSGAGAREALIVASLWGVMPEGQALGVAVVSRMIFTLVDVAMAVVAALSARRMLGRHHAVERQRVGEYESTA